MRLGTFEKQPRERISKSLFYTDALDEGDSIATVDQPVVEPAGSLVASPVLVAEDRVRIWTQGGVHNVTYKVTVTVTTAFGEILEDELIIKVREL